MKKYLLSVLVIMLVTSCGLNSDEGCDDPSCVEGVESFWRITEQQMDINGLTDGFQPVESDRTFTIFINNAFNSSGTLCTMDLEDEVGFDGRINSFDGLLEFASCDENNPDEDTIREFEVNGSELTIRFPCAGDCAWKFERVN